MRCRFLCLGLCAMMALFVETCMAQNPPLQPPPAPTSKISQRFYAGGNFGFQFGTITVLDLSPLVGYRITEKWSVGTGFTYMYYKDNPGQLTMNMYGGRVFTRYLLLENLFAHAEYELLSGVVKDGYGNSDRFTLEGQYLGGGYRQPLGPNAYLELMVLYNFEAAAYGRENPTIRVGMSFGL